MTEDTRAIELTLPASEYERLADLDGDPDAVAREAIRTELRVREGMAAVDECRGDDGEPVSPDPGPIGSPVGSLLGFELLEAGDGEAVVTMEAGRRHANSSGPVQGGILTALADTATAHAFVTTLEPGVSTTNIELKINFLRPVFEDRLEATAAVVERGRTIGLVECDVRTGAGKLAARMSTTYMILRDERGEGR